MSIRVVVLAEGSKETGALAHRPASGGVLEDDQLGPAHILVRRCVFQTSRVPETAIRMIEPHRLGTGTIARGSSLLDKGTLRKLLIWPTRDARPDLAVVLVDADGKPDRHRELSDWTRDLPLPPVIGVAIQEFEAWLVADDASVATAVGFGFPTTMAPESMEPGEAKKVLEAAIAQKGTDARQLRRTIAALADLERIARRAPAFQRFQAELSAAVRGLA